MTDDYKVMSINANIQVEVDTETSRISDITITSEYGQFTVTDCCGFGVESEQGTSVLSKATISIVKAYAKENGLTIDL